MLTSAIRSFKGKQRSVSKTKRAMYMQTLKHRRHTLSPAMLIRFCVLNLSSCLTATFR